MNSEFLEMALARAEQLIQEEVGVTKRLTPQIAPSRRTLAADVLAAGIGATARGENDLAHAITAIETTASIS
jgi:hypothetical protein